MEGPEKKTNLGPHISQNCCSVYLNPNVISMVSYCLDDMNPHNLFNHGNLFPSLLHPLSVSVFCLVRFERHYRLCCLSILCFYLRPWQCSGLRHGAVTNIYPSSWLWKAGWGLLSPHTTFSLLISPQRNMFTFNNLYIFTSLSFRMDAQSESEQFLTLNWFCHASSKHQGLKILSQDFFQHLILKIPPEGNISISQNLVMRVQCCDLSNWQSDRTSDFTLWKRKGNE